MRIVRPLTPSFLASTPRRALTVGGLLVLLALAAPRGIAQTPATPPPQTPAAARPADANPLIARGEYITTHGSMCVQCHSGRDARGEIIESLKFHGGAIPFRSPWPNKEWAYQAPNIAGLPGFTDEQIIALLTEGAATGRTPPRPPMPPFRLTREDAQAVVAYLRTR